MPPATGVGSIWFLVFGPMLFGQEGVFHVTSDLAVVNATVLNNGNQFVTGLSQSNFRLKVDGQKTPIEGFWQEDEPISAVVVLDASGSMKSALRYGRLWLNSLFKFMHPDDEYALLVCQDGIDIAVPFTTEIEPILHSMSQLAAHGSTPLYDAVDQAVQFVRGGQQSRKVVIVVTDGEDTTSRLRLLQLEKRIMEADVHLYVVQLWQGSDSSERLALQESAESNGGVFFKDVSLKDFTRILTQLDIHQQYMIAFRPKKPLTGTKKFHRIQLSVSTNKAEPARAYYRAGYYEGN